MLTISAFFIILFSSSSANALTTKYKWISETNRIQDGNCYEVDKESEGKNFLKKVKAENCKPLHTYFAFNLGTGNCVEIDKETEGAHYYQKTTTSKCAPKETKYILGAFLKKEGCYQVDKNTQGHEFFNKVDVNYCQDKDTKYTWEYKSQEFGRCYQVNINNNTKVAVKNTFCRPELVEYKFMRETPFKGICLEMDTKNKFNYSFKVPLRFCKPKRTIFVFYKNENELSGKCYEIDEDTKGEEFVQESKLDQCKK